MTAVRFPKFSRAVWIVVLAALAIGGARLMTFTDWAATNATIAALLFAWVVIDALCLSTIAKAEDRKPKAFAMLGAAALGAFLVLVGGAPTIRERIIAMPPLLAALAGTIAIWGIWAALKLRRERLAGKEWEGALAEVVPGPFAKFYVTELRMMHLALFVWRRPPDVPEGTQGFAYHRYLTPMVATFIGLQVIELGVVHLLLMLWNPVVAWVVFAVTLGGLLWFVALTKSFRLMPVLVAKDHVRVRAGAPVDFRVPMHAIAAVGETFDADMLKAKTTFNGAILSSPNVTLRLARPVAMPTLLGREKMVERLALRLDDPVAFRAALDDALASRQT